MKPAIREVYFSCSSVDLGPKTFSNHPHPPCCSSKTSQSPSQHHPPPSKHNHRLHPPSYVMMKLKIINIQQYCTVLTTDNPNETCSGNGTGTGKVKLNLLRRMSVWWFRKTRIVSLTPWLHIKLTNCWRTEWPAARTRDTAQKGLRISRNINSVMCERGLRLKTTPEYQ